jgi:geranylgeranyl reductase family protein
MHFSPSLPSHLHHILSTQEFPIVIAGAGPAGVITSLVLSQAGQPHLILDKAQFPRDKICGDAVSGKPLDILMSLVPEQTLEFCNSADALDARGIQFVAPNGRSVDIPFPAAKIKGPVGVVSRREVFDNFLFTQLQNRSAEIWQNAEVKGAEKTANGVRLEIEKDGTTRYVTTPLVIAADGSRSMVKRALLGDDQEDEHFCGGIRAYYKGVSDLHAQNFIELHFLKELLPGYFWIFPMQNGYANVGMGMLSSKIKKNKVNLRKAMLDAIENHPALKERFANATLDGKIIGWGLPLGSKKRPLSGDNFMLTGDAGSLIDPFTGEGIGNATVSGLVAGRQALKAVATNTYSASDLAAYDEVVYGKLWDELKTSHRLQKLSSYPWLFNFVVNRLRSSPAMRELFTNMFTDLDIRAKMKNPLFYFRLLFR